MGIACWKISREMVTSREHDYFCENRSAETVNRSVTWCEFLRVRYHRSLWIQNFFLTTWYGHITLPVYYLILLYKNSKNTVNKFWSKYKIDCELICQVLGRYHLILVGKERYYSSDFELYFKKNHITVLYMHLHFSIYLMFLICDNLVRLRKPRIENQEVATKR